MSDETIPEYLARMKRKHAEKGEHGICGARGTGEIARFFGIKNAKALHQLRRLEMEGAVTCLGRVHPEGWLWTTP